MAGKIEIINIALSRIGESPIQNLDEGSNAANAAKLIYDTSRKAALRSYAWSFATVTSRLTRMAVPGRGFRYAYALPSDCLRLLVLRSHSLFTDSGVPFTVQGRTVMTDAEDPEADYVRDEGNEEKFDAEFTEAFTIKLASDLAMPVKNSGEYMSAYARMFNDMIHTAAVGSKRETRKTGGDNPFLEARYE